VAPASASAAVLEYRSVGENQEIFYEAGSGERNRVVASTDGALVTFQDQGAVIQTGMNCDSVSEHVATCDYGAFAAVNMILKGRRDSSRLVGDDIRVFADGGAGADRLRGGALFDLLEGGRGPDVLVGRGSVDRILYTGRPDDLHVTLADGKRNDGGRRDGRRRDRLRGIEGVNGGDGDDVLIGDAEDNSLVGGNGRNVLRGRGGDDDLIGGDGRDLAVGGAGADLFPGSGGNDRAKGGGGPDHFQSGSTGNGRDLFVGGGGIDTAQFQNGANRLSLDGEANDGPCADPACTASNEGDNLIGIEDLLLGFGDDVLIGSKRDEIFRPSLGADRVRARGGDDTIHVNEDGDPDLYDCGGGVDVLIGTPDAFDQNPNCE